MGVVLLSRVSDARLSDKGSSRSLSPSAFWGTRGCFLAPAFLRTGPKVGLALAPDFQLGFHLLKLFLARLLEVANLQHLSGAREEAV